MEAMELVLPWLSPRDLASLSISCSTLAKCVTLLNASRAADVTQGCERIPARALNMFDRHPYPYFRYTPSCTRGALPSLWPWPPPSASFPAAPHRPNPNLEEALQSPHVFGCCCSPVCSGLHTTAEQRGENLSKDSIRTSLEESENCQESSLPQHLDIEEEALYGGSCMCGQTLNGWPAYNQDNRLCDELLETTPCVIECGIACSCDQSCAKRLCQQGLRTELFVKRHMHKGWGLHAAQLIPKGSFICEYAGELLTIPEAQMRQKMYDVERCRSSALLVLREHLPSGEACLRLNIDATESGNIARFINHACDGGNLLPCFSRMLGSLLPRLVFFAKQDIAKDEELTFSYGKPGEGAKENSKRCYCGTNACLGLLPFEQT